MSFCGQVEGLPIGVSLSSPGRRLGGWLLNWVLVLVTLGIGWLIWAFLIFDKGQTPGWQLLNMRAVSIDKARTASWGTMFLREFIAKPLIGVLSVLTFGIVNFWLVWDTKNQELWDKVVSTVVVDDPARLMAG